MEDSIKGALVMVGLDTPLKRFAVCTALPLAAEYFFKAPWAFAVGGQLKPFFLFPQSKDSQVPTTMIPIGTVPVLIGTAAALFL